MRKLVMVLVSGKLPYIPYSKGLAEEIEKFLREIGDAEFVFYDEIVPGQSDYSVVLARMHTGPDLIYFSGFYLEAGLMLRQKR